MVVTIVLVAFFSLQISAGQIDAARRKAETLAQGDKLFGQRYSPPTGKPLRLYDERTEIGPPDAVTYWYNTRYVIELVLAPDGSVARIQLLPEELLYSKVWSAVPDTVELSPTEMQSVVESANALQTLGKPGAIRNAPDGCFQSGHNLYCADAYQLAVASHYHLQRHDNEHVTGIAPRDVSISYRQSVSGIVEDVRTEGSQRQLKIGGYWYHGEKSGSDIFRDATIGSVVRLVTFGCAANEKVCLAIPAASISDVTR
jgi:hypothetical protein